MATIEVRKSCSKISYRARVRVKGYPQITASFARKTDAKRWAAGIEADIHSGRYFPETHHTLSDAIKRYFYDVLQAGQFDYGDYVKVDTWDAPIQVATKDLIGAFRTFDKTAERHRPMVDAEFVPEVKKIFPSATSKRWKVRGEQIRGIAFPRLERAREEFTRHIGFEVEWEEIVVDDEPEVP